MLYANLTRGLGLEVEPGAHVMTLPYTPLQSAARFVEEDGALAESLDGMPVVCCSLHSQVAPAVAGVGEGVRVAYVQLPGGALPVSLSDSLRVLKGRGLVETAVAAGACFDGDVQAVGVASALAWAAGRGSTPLSARSAPESLARAHPSGTVGWRRLTRRTRRALSAGRRCWPCASRTATSASGTEASRITRGRCWRWLSASGASRGRPGLDAPDWLTEREEVDVTGWREACDGLILEHMGRGPDDDPWFFASAFAAGKLARAWCPEATSPLGASDSPGAGRGPPSVFSLLRKISLVCSENVPRVWNVRLRGPR